MALRNPGLAPAVRPIPLCQGTLALEHQPAPCQLDHAAAHPCIAGSSEPPFAALAPTFIWRACQATIARYSPLIPQLAGEHFMDEHVGSLDTESRDRGEHAYHRMSSLARCSL